MIFDNIRNIKYYKNLSHELWQGFNLINDYKNREPGKYEIDGTNLFVLVQDYDTKLPEVGRFEAHRKYIDIQYIVSGEEYIGYQDTPNLTLCEEYNAERDIEFYQKTNNALMLNCQAGTFTVFFAGEPHMPCISIDKVAPVRKIVVKIKAT